MLRIPQNTSITGTALSDCLVSYLRRSFGGGGFTPLQMCSRCILQPFQPIGEIVFFFNWKLLSFFLLSENPKFCSFKTASNFNIAFLFFMCKKKQKKKTAYITVFFSTVQLLLISLITDNQLFYTYILAHKYTFLLYTVGFKGF